MKLKKLKWVHYFLNLYNPLFGKMKKTATFSSDIKFNSIVIFSTTALGDFMFNTPAIRAIRAHYPDAHITLVSSVKNKLLVENYEQIDSVVYWDNKIRNLLPVALQVKKYKPELAIILHSHLPYDVLFAVMAGCQYILRNTYDVIPAWFRKWLVAEYQPQSGHFIQRKLNLLKQLNITENISPEMMLTCPFSPLEPSSQPVIGFQLGTSSPIRTWSINNYVELAKKIINNNPHSVIKLIGSPRELSLASQFMSLMPSQYQSNIVDLIGKTSLPELIAHIDNMTVLVTGDTGPLHLAIALKTPTVSLFVTADPKNSGPYQDIHIHQVIKKEPDSRYDHPMDQIEIHEVFQKVIKVLSLEE
ncbi:TPA: glycosyltransferase family 9 protein [Proteus mirabilis]|nr:glycosyltransferase family 9 protein [Proteus mirabilis]